MATQPQQKRGKKCKRPDQRPARRRYWTRGRLALKKLRNLIRSGYSPEAALAYWTKTRKRYYGELPRFTELKQL